MTLNETHIFGPKLVNEARFGFNRIDITFEPNAKLNPVDYGINDGVTTAIGIPQITIVGLGLNFGGPSNFPQGRTDTSFVFSDTRELPARQARRSSSAASSAGSWPTASRPTPARSSSAASRRSRPAWATTSPSRWAIVQPNVRQGALGLFVQDSLRATLEPVVRARVCATTRSWRRPRPRTASWCSTRPPDSLVQSGESVPDRPQPAAARRRDLESVEATSGRWCAARTPSWSISRSPTSCR